LVHRGGSQYLDPQHGRYLAEHIAGARYLKGGGRRSRPVPRGPQSYPRCRGGLRNRRGGGPMRSTGSSPSAFITDVVGSTELAARLGDARWGSCSMSTMPGSCSRSRPADPQKCGPRVRVEVGDVEAGGRRTDPELGHDVEMAVASNRGEPKGLRGRVLSERVEEREAVHTSFRKVHECGVSAHRGRMCRRIVAALHDP
jgi:hypothetical protein